MLRKRIKYCSIVVLMSVLHSFFGTACSYAKETLKRGSVRRNTNVQKVSGASRHSCLHQAVKVKICILSTHTHKKEGREIYSTDKRTKERWERRLIIPPMKYIYRILVFSSKFNVFYKYYHRQTTCNLYKFCWNFAKLWKVAPNRL